MKNKPTKRISDISPSAIVPGVAAAEAGTQERLLGIIAAAPDAILTIDEENRVTLFNAAAEQMFRCTAADAIGSLLDRFIPERFRAVHRQHVARFGETGVTSRVMGHQRPLAALRADGVEFPVEATISQVSVGGRRLFTAIVRDISGRRRAEEALRASEARLRAIVETAADAIITIDERGVVESANPAAERMFGYARDEMVGQNVAMLMPEPYAGQHDDYLERYVRGGAPRVIGIGREVVGRRKDGTTFPHDLSVNEFRVDGRRMFAGVMHDLSERRRLEREVLEAGAAEQRRIAQDLHDGLCQELLGIAFGVESLTKRLETAAPAEFERAQRLGDHLESALAQARTLAHGLDPVDFQAGGLPDALNALAEKVSEVFHVECVFRQIGHALPVDANAATHFYRIAQESVTNAIKHGRASRIEIQLAGGPAAGTLTIRDNGTGIRDVPKQHGGRGLQIMAYRARLIGASLVIEPASDGGTAVTCTIRLLERDGGTSAAARAEQVARTNLRGELDSDRPVEGPAGKRRKR